MKHPLGQSQHKDAASTSIVSGLTTYSKCFPRGLKASEFKSVRLNELIPKSPFDFPGMSSATEHQQALAKTGLWEALGEALLRIVPAWAIRPYNPPNQPYKGPF